MKSGDFRLLHTGVHVRYQELVDQLQAGERLVATWTVARDNSHGAMCLTLHTHKVEINNKAKILGVWKDVEFFASSIQVDGDGGETESYDDYHPSTNVDNTPQDSVL